MLEDEYLLKKNEVQIESNTLSRDEKLRLRELAYASIYLKPNSNYILFIPKERAPLKYRFASDTPKVAAFFMRIDGEAPALIDSSGIQSVANNLVNTLRSEGYYDAEVTYSIDYGDTTKRNRKKLIPVTYNLFPKRVYRLDTAQLISRDTGLITSIKSLPSNTKLVRDAPVSANLRNSEIRRISEALRNDGYYDFSPAQFSRFIARDTTAHMVDLDLVIYPPDVDSFFKQYTVGEIYIYPGFDSEKPESSYRDTIIGLHHFRTQTGNFIVKPKFISEKIAIRSGDLYSYTVFRKTILQLNTLDIFRTPRISIRKRNDTSDVLDYHIYLYKEKKYEDEAGIENFLSSLSANQLLLGASLNAGRRIRNAFGGSETVSLGLSGSVETAFAGSSNDNDIITLGIDVGLATPRYKDILSLSIPRLIPAVRKYILTDSFMSDLNSLGAQTVSLSYDYVDFENFFTSTSIRLSRGVRVVRANHQFGFVFQEFDLFSPTQGNNFDTLIGDNQVFKQSFNEQLITGLLFRSFDYAYSSPIRKKKSYDVFFSFEASGHELSLFNYVSGADFQGIRFGDSLFQFSQFIKVEFEPKFTYYINSRSSLAFRLGIGAAVPYGKNQQIPYGELFSLGGSYSLRGWRNRDIGPGFINTSGTTIPFAADQAKFELSAEYRFELGWIIEGALFGETGNVWAIRDPTPETQISLKSLAVDVGAGIRFDLTFFLFRFDMAFRARNWFPDANGKHWRTSSLSQFTRNPNFTIGINYPF